MLLYHGSNIEVVSPGLHQAQRALDFGPAFYMTSDYDQALKWALNVTSRRKEGSPAVSVFEIDDEALGWLDVLQFGSADAGWLEFVTANRKGAYHGHLFDVIIGPVANDRTMTVLTLYFNGLLSEGEALERLRVQQLHDQYAFATGKALRQLSFKEVVFA